MDFCEYVRIHWQAGNVNIDGVSRTPAQHIEAQYPTYTFNVNEFVVLEHSINIPAKGKVSFILSRDHSRKHLLTDHLLQAWGKENNIVDTSRWINNMPQSVANARRILKAMRNLVGSIEYHRDPVIAGILRVQKERVGRMFGLIDQALTSRPTVVNGMPFAPWQPQDLQGRWNQFMNQKFYLAQTKTTKVINDYLPRLQEVWANQGLRDANVDQPSDGAQVLAQKQATRNLIDDIDALADRMRTLPAWRNPF